jgi:hypothetical protein
VWCFGPVWEGVCLEGELGCILIKVKCGRLVANSASVCRWAAFPHMHAQRVLHTHANLREPRSANPTTSNLARQLQR